MNQKIIHFSNANLPQLSNFYALTTPLPFLGASYATSEHLYQALKYAYFQDHRTSMQGVALIEEIRTQSTPYKAKVLASGPPRGKPRYEWQQSLYNRASFYAKQGVTLHPSWEEVKVNVMKDVLRLKFFCNPDCYATLLSTGDAMLVERTDSDAFWGDGRQGTGQNILGKLLMRIRSDPFPEKQPVIFLQTSKK